MRARLVVSVLVVMALVYSALAGWRYLLRHANAQLRATIPLVIGEDAAEASLPSFEVARQSSRYDLGKSRRVTIENPFGNVTVGRGGRQVTVASVAYTHAETREAAAAKAAPFHVAERRDAGGGLTISVAGNRKDGHVTIDLTVAVPADVDLRVDARSGTVWATGLRAPVTVEVGSGDIIARGLDGHAHLATGSGNITADGARGGLTAKSGSGNIRLAAVAGETLAHTDSGNVDATISASRRVVAGSGSGNVMVKVMQPFAGELEASTSSGNVTVSLPPGSDCQVRAASRSGNVSSTLPLVDAAQSNSELRGRLGAGRGNVVADSGSGDVTLQENGRP